MFLLEEIMCDSLCLFQTAHETNSLSYSLRFVFLITKKKRKTQKPTDVRRLFFKDSIHK